VRVEFHPEADLEFTETLLWYDERSQGLANEFTSAVTSFLNRLASSPQAFPKWPRIRPNRKTAIRRAVMDRFPYVVAFEEHADVIVILALAHAKRRPLYWLKRASSG
jgi:toxin ParE1/3/4